MLKTELYCLLAVAFALPAAATAPRQSLIEPDSYRALAADSGAHRVGDVLTVYVLETTRARSGASTDAGSELQLRGEAGSSSNRNGGSASLSGSNRGSAQTSRVGELRAQISVRVVEMVDGMLRVEGSQTLAINGERQRIALSGLVRPEDVAPDNTVLSHRIAEAQVELDGAGVVSGSQRQSIVYRAMKWLRLL